MAGFNIKVKQHAPAKKNLVGVDVFIHDNNRDATALAERLQKAVAQNLELTMITNRGTKVWPNGFPETFCTDHWRCRFKQKNGVAPAYTDVVSLMGAVGAQGLDVIKTENLYEFDGVAGYTAAQGQ